MQVIRKPLIFSGLSPGTSPEVMEEVEEVEEVDDVLR
jgi:hypothetical protein